MRIEPPGGCVVKNFFRSVRVVLGTVILSPAICAAIAGNGPPKAERRPDSKAGERLDRTVRDHLETGQVEAAIRAVQRSLAAHPGDPDIRERFVTLHVSLARGLLGEEDFLAAERALRSVLKVDSNHAEARRLLGVIGTARRAAPERVERARRWIEVEWFEPAFNALRQAGALLPERKHEWASSYRAAAIGTGDDDYFSKNFHEAFYFYDAAIRLGEARDNRPSSSLIGRWMQCMAHALAADIDRARYPPSYWKMAIRRAEGLGYDGAGSADLKALLRGLAYENLGDVEQASAEYGKVIGRPVVSLDGDLIARSRKTALKTIRRWYDPALSDRRAGVWSRNEGGEWQVLSRPGFRIHHRNAKAAERIASAGIFYFRRIADLLALDVEEVPWPVACDVFLHADEAAFREATGQQGPVRAISTIETQGGKLLRHSIHVHQRDPLLMSASLSHELAHLIVGAVVGYRPGKAVLNEGIALHVEPECRHRQFGRLFGAIERPRRIQQLLSIGEMHPPEPDFYTEAYRLVWVLRRGGDLSRLVVEDGSGLNRTRLAKRFGFSGGKALEKAYARK
ncbi:MAG: tetratricopeptide repeat protein [Phycisphaerae bacterium]